MSCHEDNVDHDDDDDEQGRKQGECGAHWMLWPHYCNNATRVITSHHSINPTAGLPFSIDYDLYYHHYLHQQDYCNHGTPCHNIIQLITPLPCCHTMKCWHYDSCYHHFYQFHDWLKCGGRVVKIYQGLTNLLKWLINVAVNACRITKKLTHSAKRAIL